MKVGLHVSLAIVYVQLVRASAETFAHFVINPSQRNSFMHRTVLATRLAQQWLIHQATKTVLTVRALVQPAHRSHHAPLACKIKLRNSYIKTPVWLTVPLDSFPKVRTVKLATQIAKNAQAHLQLAPLVKGTCTSITQNASHPALNQPSCKAQTALTVTLPVLSALQLLLNAPFVNLGFISMKKLAKNALMGTLEMMIQATVIKTLNQSSQQQLLLWKAQSYHFLS